MSTEPAGLAEAKTRARASWAAGDYAAVARNYTWPAGEVTVDLVGVRPGEEVLDIACGTGNASIRAARAGGRVTGVDLTPELFADARAEADREGVEFELVEGDAEDLPFPDGRFDVALSVFGIMFAPRHRVAADELVRVLRPGGRFALANWTPEGRLGDLFKALASFAPPPPSFAEPPLLWGDEGHVASLFDGVDLEFVRASLPLPDFGGVDGNERFLTEQWGPLVAILPWIEQQGRRAELTARLAELYTPGEPADYLVAVGRRPT